MGGIQQHLFDVEAAKRRLQEGTGGYEVVQIADRHVVLRNPTTGTRVLRMP